MTQRLGIDVQLDQLARSFESLDTALDAVCQSLRQASAQHTGPATVTATFEQSLQRLARTLGSMAGQARDAALVVRSNVVEEPVTDSPQGAPGDQGDAW